MIKNTTKFKETEIGTIPKEWDVVNLTEIADVIGGGTPKTSESSYWNGNIPWLSVVDFNNDSRKVYSTEKFITDEGLKNSSTKVLKKDALVISARGTVGALTQLGVDMAFNQSCYGLVAKSISGDLLYYLVKNVVADIQKRTHGSVFDTITRETLDGIKLGLPTNISEQKQIAEILSSLDDKIELNRQINASLEKIASSLFKHWFVDFEFPDKNGKPYKSSGGKMIDSELGEIPEGWKVSIISEELQTFLGGTPSREKDSYWINGTVPWINSGMVNEYRVTKASEYITKEAVENSATKLLPKGTVVIAITGATLGQYSMLEIDSCFNQSVIGIKENKKLKKEFIYYWIATTINELINAQTGGAQQHINKQVVDSHKILIPDQITLDKYYNIASPIFELISQNCFEIENLSGARDSLLPRLMSGKIRVKI